MPEAPPAPAKNPTDAGASTDAALLNKPGEGSAKPADQPAKSEGDQPPGAPPAEKKDPPAKTEDKPKGERVVPERYELKLPEGSHLKPADLERIASHAKAQKLTLEEAQADVEIESDIVRTYVEAQKAEHESKVKSWIEATKADAEVGGEAFTKNAELIKRVVDRFAPDDFKKALETSGLGNHPALNRFLLRIGKSMSEDSLVLPGAAPKPKPSVADIFYPDQSKGNT